MMISEKKKNRAIQNGSFERVDQLLSASQLLLAEAHSLIDEATDVLKMNGLCTGEVFKAYNLYQKGADRYFHTFGSLVKVEEKKMKMFKDMDRFDELFREWSLISKDWKPKEVI